MVGVFLHFIPRKILLKKIDFGLFGARGVSTGACIYRRKVFELNKYCQVQLKDNFIHGTPLYMDRNG